MKVVQINAVYGYGSTGRIVKELGEEMDKRGIENYIFHSGKKNELSKTVFIGNKIDQKMHAVCSRITGKQAYFSYLSTLKLIGQLKKISPDIVHLHNLHSNYINLKLLLKYLINNNIATVITLHDCWFYTGKCAHYTLKQCYKWQTGCNHCPQLKEYNKSWFLDSTLKMWKDKKDLFASISRLAVIGVSDWITNEAKKSYLKNASIIKRIYNWIDLDVFFLHTSNIREKYNIPADKKIILSVGSGWDENSEKFNDIIKLSKMIDNNTNIVLVGGGIRNNILTPNIIHIDYIADISELSDIYSMADVYVHLSREDSFGKVVAEAIACGTPAIVYNSTALPELVNTGCGIVVRCGDINAVKKAIDEIFSNGKNVYTANCINSARRLFNKDDLLSDTINVYTDLITMSGEN